MTTKYDPNNPLTDKELDEMAEHDFNWFLEYLDSKSEYLKTKSRPLNSHELKKISFLDEAARGDSITKEKCESIKKQGKENEKHFWDKKNGI